MKGNKRFIIGILKSASILLISNDTNHCRNFYQNINLILYNRLNNKHSTGSLRHYTTSILEDDLVSTFTRRNNSKTYSGNDILIQIEFFTHTHIKFSAGKVKICAVSSNATARCEIVFEWDFRRVMLRLFSFE